MLAHVSSFYSFSTGSMSSPALSASGSSTQGLRSMEEVCPYPQNLKNDIH